MKLSDNTAKGPDIYFSVVAHSEDDLRGSVIATLDVSVDGFVFKTAGAEVDDSDSGLVGFLEQDVFRLEIGVDDFALMQKMY